VLSDANYGVVIAVFALGVVALAMNRSRFGFGLRSLASSDKFAEYAGVEVAHARRWAFLLSGALAGVGGAVEVLGVQHRFIAGFAGQLGFQTILVANVGLFLPVGILLAGIFFGLLQYAGLSIANMTHLSSYFVTLITAVFVLVFIGDPVRAVRSRWRKRHG
jgi:simple sugar transport system permease protein